MRSLPDRILSKVQYFQAEESRYRSLLRIINSQQFFEAWISAVPETRKEALAFIDAEDAASLRKWIKDKGDLESKTLPELTEIASKLRIPNYSRLGKYRLILEIQKCQK